MHRWLIKMLRWTDVRLIYAFSDIFIVPVCLVLCKSRGIIYSYFRERFGYNPLKAAWWTYKNHCRFSEAVIDKFAMYAGKKFDIDVEGYEHFLHLAEQPDGFVMLSAHVGNYEIAGYTLVAKKKPINALVYFGEKQTVMQNREMMFASTNIRMISVKSDMSHLFEIDHILQNGETLSMPADRILGSPKAIEAEFLGAKARFPQGPFSVTAMRGLDVLAVNVMKTSWKHYRVYVTPLVYDKGAPRKAQTAELSRAYVGELERIVRLYPEQWYNYYAFWN